MRDIKYNGVQYLDLLRTLDERLWEQVLDLIADHHTEQLTITEQNINGYYLHDYCEGDIIIGWCEE